MKSKITESSAINKSVNNVMLEKKKGKVRAFQGRGIFKRGKRQFVKPERGVVYLKHIPHGFFEEQILKYFGQFGRVTAHNLPRAKTGRPKGYAFIEFEHPEVAKIAADTMNNYLMYDRMLKAEYIPPENQKPHKFALAKRDKARKTTLKDLADNARRIDKANKNRILTKEQESDYVNRQKEKIAKIRRKLKWLGIDYDFQVANEPVVLTKVNALPESQEMVVIEVDESDEEISFKTPPNAIKRPIKKSETKVLLLDNKENEKKETKKKKEKVKKSKKLTKTITESINSAVAEEEKSPSASSKKSLDSFEDFSEKKPTKIKTKISGKKTKTKTEVEHSVKSDKNGGILKKFKKSDTTKKATTKILGVMKKNKGKTTNTEPDKLKKKMKRLNLAGVKHMMNTFEF